MQFKCEEITTPDVVVKPKKTQGIAPYLNPVASKNVLNKKQPSKIIPQVLPPSDPDPEPPIPYPDPPGYPPDPMDPVPPVSFPIIVIVAETSDTNCCLAIMLKLNPTAEID